MSENLRELREFTRSWLQRIPAYQPGAPILEIGPMQPGGIFNDLPETYVDTRALFAGRGHITLDLHGGDITANAEALPFASGVVGTVLLMHVLEHVRNPFAVAREVVRVLRRGGRAYVLTPWMLRLHGPRPDCWRISDDGLEVLFAGIELVSVSFVGGNAAGLEPAGFAAEFYK